MVVRFLGFPMDGSLHARHFQPIGDARTQALLRRVEELQLLFTLHHGSLRHSYETVAGAARSISHTRLPWYSSAHLTS